MKIFVKNRNWIKKHLENNQMFFASANFISIYENNSYFPFPDRFNILKLCFDDVTETDYNTPDKDELVFFNKDHAIQIKNFIDSINKNRILYIHCKAGISRSGAVGYVLNEYFNKYLKLNKIDNESFINNNKQILPNPLVVRLLKPIIFGESDYSIIFKDIKYNEDGDELVDFKKI